MEYLQVPGRYLAVFLLLAFCSLLIGTIIRRIFFHPLSIYPGPWLGKCSDLVTIASVFKKERTFKQYELLKKYGSPVRLGTNHLVYADIESVRDIYSQSSKPCLKDGAVYDGLSATGAVNVLNAVDRDQHARIRRLISHSFSLESILETESLVQAKVEEYVSVFQGRKGQPVDILERTYQLFLDIVSQLSFGESFDCLSGKSTTAHKDIQAFFTIVPAMAFAPILRYAPIEALREGQRGLARLQELSKAHVSAYVGRSAEKSDHGLKGKFLEKLAGAVDAETGTKLTKEELVENAIIFLTAGSGTTAATVIYLLWECGRHPGVKERLIAEIRARFPNARAIPTYKEVVQLVNGPPSK